MLCATTLPRLSALALSSFLCGFSSHVSNVPQLEMSKQDDRGSEESANQTSVSRKKKKKFQPSPHLSRYCVVSLFFLPFTFLSTLSQRHDRSLQASPIHCDCICHWINHTDTTGLRNKGAIKSKWLAHVRMSARPRPDTHSRRVLWID